MLSLSVEWKVHPEEVESEVFRSRLQLFSLAGAASRADLSGSVGYLPSAHLSHILTLLNLLLYLSFKYSCVFCSQENTKLEAAANKLAVRYVTPV